MSEIERREDRTPSTRGRPGGSRIVTLQRRMVELGRIRIGATVEGTRKDGSTYTRPVKLDTFRLTSRSRRYLEAAAEVYGGTPVEWKPEDGAPEPGLFELVTDADTLRVLIPPDQFVEQSYELWTGGGCVRRCDGLTETLSMSDCKCEREYGSADSEERRNAAANGDACKPTTRLSVMLPDLPGLGRWRLETHGYYAATELPAVADLLSRSDGALPAYLRLEERTVKRPGEPTKRFVVPVLDVDAKLGEVLESVGATLEPGTSKPLRGRDAPALRAGPVGEGRRGVDRVPLGDEPEGGPRFETAESPSTGDDDLATPPPPPVPDAQDRDDDGPLDDLAEPEPVSADEVAAETAGRSEGPAVEPPPNPDDVPAKVWRKLHAVRRDHGITDLEWRAILHGQYGVRSGNDLRLGQVRNLIVALEESETYEGPEGDPITVYPKAVAAQEVAAAWIDRHGEDVETWPVAGEETDG